MRENEEQLSLKKLQQGTAVVLIITSLATWAMIRKGSYNSYKIAMLFYSNSGGGGLNVYKQQVNGKLQRCFAIDYHPFWDKATQQQSEWKLHYHRGKNPNQMKKHRPYEGGWW